MASIEIVSGLVLMASAGSVSVAHQAIHDRCHVEVQQLCTAIPADTVVGCLKAHGSRLSPACRSAIDAAGASHSAQSAN
jgi:hypothetical protein